MAQITLNSTGVASDGALVLQSNGTTAAVTVSTGQVATLVNDAVVNGLTVGRGAGAVSTNTAVGASALSSNTSGALNVAVGTRALQLNTTSSENTALGYEAAQATTGSGVTAVGKQTLASNTSGSNNTAVGTSALVANTTASNNTAVGYQAGNSNTTGIQNAFFGASAGVNITTGTEVTAIGYAAMSGSGSAASYSTAIGRAALNVVTGTLNTAIGNGSGSLITSGSKNTIIGSFSGNQDGVDIRTASNHIVLSDGDGTVRLLIYNTGYFVTGTGANSPYNNTTGSSANMFVGSDGALFRSTSSLKYKRDVNDANHGLVDLLKLRSVTYKQKMTDIKGNNVETIFGGLIAEEVHEAGLTEFVQYAEDGSPDALAYGNMVSLCIKAIQELKAEFDAYKATHP